jgi:ADP-dependent NAD(P)H-hydrate dehydratase / NAD(P)H-hydrate epimerase
MQSNYWHKQTADKPLFPDLLWSRPENRAQAGKLSIIGGHAQSFAAAATAYAAAETAGIGAARVLLPDSLEKTVGRVFAAGEYAPSTPSGSLSRQALDTALELAAWSDGLLIAGDLGHNSETAILLEKLAQDYSGQLTLTKDAVDYFTATPQVITNRPATLAVLSFAQLQKLAMQARFAQAFTFSMDLLRLIDALHAFTQQHQLALIVKHLEHLLVAVDGQVSSTKLDTELPTWRVKTAARAGVWWLQNPGKPFPALTTALVAE